METIIGFVIGYLVGTKQGREGLEKVRQSVEAIRDSPQTREFLATGAGVLGAAVKQVVGGGAGVVLTGAVDAFTRKANEVITAIDTERRAA